MGLTPVSIPLSCDGGEEKDLELARLGQQLLATYYNCNDNNNDETTNIQHIKV